MIAHSYNSPGDRIGDFIAVRHKKRGEWLFRCAHCRMEKTASFSVMRRTGMQHCACQKPVLTSAQQRVHDLFEQGYRNCEIAKLLGLNPRTISFHLSAIYEKRLQSNV